MQPLSAPPRYTRNAAGDLRQRAATWQGGPALKPQAPREKRRQGAARDTSSSIWSYRMQRIMLTPYLRRLLRVGLPMAVLLGVGAIYLSDEQRLNAIIAQYEDLRAQFQQRPEFMVATAQVEGASPELVNAVLARLNLELPQSSFDLDLIAAQERVLGLDAIKSAELRVRPGGVLQVIVTEREPALVWRHDAGVMLIDETGHRVADLVSRSDRADLPLIGGQGADVLTPEALDIFAAAGPLMPRVRGLIRIGERRWDLMLDRDQRILLPEANPARAVERLLALDHAQTILARDVAAVDLRIPHRPTLRLTGYAMNELRRAKGLAIVETDL